MSTKSRPIVTGVNPSEHYNAVLEIQNEKEVVTVAARLLRSEYNYDTGEMLKLYKLKDSEQYAVVATDYADQIYYGTSEVYDNYGKAINKYVSTIRELK